MPSIIELTSIPRVPSLHLTPCSTPNHPGDGGTAIFCGNEVVAKTQGVAHLAKSKRSGALPLGLRWGWGERHGKTDPENPGGWFRVPTAERAFGIFLGGELKISTWSHPAHHLHLHICTRHKRTLRICTSWTVVSRRHFSTSGSSASNRR